MADDPLDLPGPKSLPHGAVLGLVPHHVAAEAGDVAHIEPPLDLPKPGSLPPGAVLDAVKAHAALDVIEQKLEELRVLSSQLRAHLGDAGS